MGADNPAWVLSEAGAVRALPVALTLMDQARAREHDTELGNGLTDRAVGLLGRDAVLAIIGLQNAGNLPECGTPARERLPGRVLAEDRAAVMEAAEAASQIPASHHPTGLRRRVLVPRGRGAGQLGLAGPP